jgi:hypothetical protein
MIVSQQSPRFVPLDLDLLTLNNAQHAHPLGDWRISAKEFRNRLKTVRPRRPGGRSGMALRRKRFTSTEKSSELAHEILGLQAQSISDHSTTTGS